MPLISNAYGFFKAYKKKRMSELKKDINLLPKEVLDQRRFDAWFRKTYVVFAKLALVGFALLAVPLSLNMSLEMDKLGLEKRITEVELIEDLEQEVSDTVKSLAEKQDLVSRLNDNDAVVDVVLKTMEKVIPRDVYIVSFEQTLVRESKEEVQETVVISGVSRNKEAVADFQKSLKESGIYKDVFVINVKERDEKYEKTGIITEVDDEGMVTTRKIPINTLFFVRVDFEMRCIVNEWE